MPELERRRPRLLACRRPGPASRSRRRRTRNGFCLLNGRIGVRSRAAASSASAMALRVGQLRRHRPPNRTLTVPRCANSAEKTVAGAGRHHPGQRPRQHDVAAAQPLAEARQRVGQPGERSGRVAERGRARAAVDRGAVAGEQHAEQPQVQARDGRGRAAEHHPGAARVVGDGVGDPAPPVDDRLSTTSSAGSTPPIAPSASSVVTPGPTRSVARRRPARPPPAARPAR